MDAPKTRTGRDEWRKRIERWRASGLSAEAFAAELGTKPATLKFWKYRIETEARGATAGRTQRRKAAGSASFVEVRAAVSTAASFVLELSSSRRLQIPTGFDEVALVRLLAVLERR